MGGRAGKGDWALCMGQPGSTRVNMGHPKSTNLFFRDEGALTTGPLPCAPAWKSQGSQGVCGSKTVDDAGHRCRVLHQCQGRRVLGTGTAAYTACTILYCTSRYSCLPFHTETFPGIICLSIRCLLDHLICYCRLNITHNFFNERGLSIWLPHLIPLVETAGVPSSGGGEGGEEWWW